MANGGGPLPQQVEDERQAIKRALEEAHKQVCIENKQLHDNAARLERLERAARTMQGYWQNNAVCVVSAEAQALIAAVDALDDDTPFDVSPCVKTIEDIEARVRDIPKPDPAECACEGNTLGAHDRLDNLVPEVADLKARVDELAEKWETQARRLYPLSSRGINERIEKLEGRTTLLGSTNKAQQIYIDRLTTRVGHLEEPPEPDDTAEVEVVVEAAIAFRGIAQNELTEYGPATVALCRATDTLIAKRTKRTEKP